MANPRLEALRQLAMRDVGGRFAFCGKEARYQLHPELIAEARNFLARYAHLGDEDKIQSGWIML